MPPFDRLTERLNELLAICEQAGRAKNTVSGYTESPGGRVIEYWVMAKPKRERQLTDLNLPPSVKGSGA